MFCFGVDTERFIREICEKFIEELKRQNDLRERELELKKIRVSAETYASPAVCQKEIDEV